MSLSPGYDLNWVAANQFLDTMILRIGDVKISVRVERYAPGIAEFPGGAAGLANDLERLVCRVKDLDPAVAKFANVLVALWIQTDVVWIA